MIRKILKWLGFIEEREKPKSRHTYVVDLVLKAKNHQWELGNHPTKLNISEDMLMDLECHPDFLSMKNGDQIFGLKVNIITDKELYIDVE